MLMSFDNSMAAPPVVNVEINANGGTFEDGSEIRNEMQTGSMVAPDAPTREGYQFYGWLKVDSSMSYSVYQPGEYVAIGDSPRLIAQWSDKYLDAGILDGYRQYFDYGDKVVYWSAVDLPSVFTSNPVLYLLVGSEVNMKNSSPNGFRITSISGDDIGLSIENYGLHGTVTKAGVMTYVYQDQSDSRIVVTIIAKSFDYQELTFISDPVSDGVIEYVA